MKQKSYIAAISSYGTVSNPRQRYIVALRFAKKEKLMEALKDFLPVQIMIAKTDPVYKEELEEGVDTVMAFSEISKGIKEISEQYDEVMSIDYSIRNEEKRLLLSIPEILTDFHIEIFQESEEDLSWLNDSKEIGIMADDGIEGCGGPDEFYSVRKFCDPKEEGEVHFGIKDPSPLEEWNNLRGLGMVVPLIQV